MPRIFISYRRDDSRTITGRIYDRLVHVFGREYVFKDIDSIPPGKDFRGVVKEALVGCDILLVIIGSHWVNIPDKSGKRRLDNPEDYVRIEVETGLQRDSTLVIPTLIQNTSMPDADELPLTLRELVYKNAVQVRDNPDFHRDVDTLIEAIKEANQWPRWSRKWIIGMAIVLVMIVFSVSILSTIFRQSNTVADLNLEPPTTTATYTATSTPSQTPTPTASLTYTFTVSPSNTVTETATLTNTPTVTTTYTPIVSDESTLPPEATLVITVTVSSAYPCDAAIVFNNSTLLNVVHVSPSDRSSFRAPIQQGAQVQILERAQENRTDFWYQIADSAGEELGWIPVRYVIPSDACPE